LTYLSVHKLALWGNDFEAPLSTILPRSLVTLIIKSWWSTMFEAALSGLRADCTDSLPNLQSVDCTWKPSPNQFAYKSIAALKDVGIDLKLAIYWMKTDDSDSEDLESDDLVMSSESLEHWVYSGLPDCF
jgi:hypothetical protein